LRGNGASTAKSAAFELVLEHPLLNRSAAVVVVNAGVALPLAQSAVP
jgi:hypothetical protein